MPMLVGQYTVQCIESSRFALDGGAMFGVVPKTLWSKVYPADELNRIPMAARCLVLSGRGRNVLVDTGCGVTMPEKLAKIYGIEGTTHLLELGLAQIGLQPEDISDVILTHLHFDHAGGATIRRDGQVVPTFPNATYYVQREQFEWAKKPSLKDRASYMSENWLPLLEADQLFLVEGQQEVIPGVTLERFDGHTKALQAVHVADDRNHIVFAADLVPTTAHIPVPYVMGYDNFPLISLEEKSRTFEKAVEQDWTFVFGHDAFVEAATLQLTNKGFAVKTTLTL